MDNSIYFDSLLEDFILFWAWLFTRSCKVHVSFGSLILKSTGCVLKWACSNRDTPQDISGRWVGVMRNWTGNFWKPMIVPTGEVRHLYLLFTNSRYIDYMPWGRHIEVKTHMQMPFNWLLCCSAFLYSRYTSQTEVTHIHILLIVSKHILPLIAEW